jgi:hypothetical protein
LGVSDLGRGSPPRRILNPTENCCPLRSISKKKPLSLHSWRPLHYKSHIDCTLLSRSRIQYIYVHFQWANKQLTGILLSKWNHQYSNM